MKPHKTFIFESYSFSPEKRTIELRYSLDDELHFTETLTLPERDYQRTADSHQLDPALFALHLIGGISYYKTCCPKAIDIRNGQLSQKEAAFWSEVYENGLGEFFYRNNIDFRNLLHFPSHAEDSKNQRQGDGLQLAPDSPHILVPIGGGKDSMVTVELLKDAGFTPILLRMGSHPIIDALAAASGCEILIIDRSLSPLLFELNAQGALNGHIPISAYLSALSVVMAILLDIPMIIMSNERSANIGSVMFYGKDINHQWSKSLQFERMFQDYVREEISSSIKYFSLLRPLSELGIVRLFSHLPEYFPLATSCNANWKILERERNASAWCHRCPKCAFAFALYAAFLPMEDVVKIFGKNLFEDRDLLPLFSELLGLTGIKPFECVGTPEETKAAFLLIHERGDAEKTAAMQMFLTQALPHIADPKAVIRDALTLSPEHTIPAEFSTVIPT